MKTQTNITTTNVVHIREGHKLRAARIADGRELKRISTPCRVSTEGRAVRRRPRQPAA